jgi:PAS domain S-box-containing protein
MLPSNSLNLHDDIARADGLEVKRQEALLKTGALQNAILTSENFSIIATDEKGIIQLFNVGAERMLGYTAEEVVNKINPSDIHDPKEVMARAQALSLELATTITPGFEALVFKASRGIEDIYELTYIRKDGSRYPAIVSVTALRDDFGTIIGYLLIGTDNTVRKRAEEEQNRLEQRLRDQQFYTRSLIESSVDALMTTDPKGYITDVNRQMEELTGRTRDELIGAPFKHYFTDPDRAQAGIDKVLRETKVTNYELVALSSEGMQTLVSYSASTFYDRDRQLLGVFAAARDITDKKLLDKILQDKNLELESATAFAEKANRAKSDFLSSMSHELRTPLSAILGFAQLIESGTPPPTPSQKRSVDQILQSGWYLLDLINEILDLALIESGKLSLSLEPVSLAEVMLECETMIEPQADKRGISVSFPELGVPLFVKADRRRLKQVLINLLSNAIKYNILRGKVTVTCELLAAQHIRICVEDTGAGLSAEEIEQLFQPFNRLGQETATEQGTGIGLVMTKRLVELMGGVIAVESTVGKGSRFWLELDATTAKNLYIGNIDAVSGVTPAPASDPDKFTLLYVEDNPANLMLVEDLIARRPNISLLSAKDGISGVEIARAELPDVILMDINLPGISGTHAMRILAADVATASIPVVALSANAMPRDIEKGLEAGFYKYLTKPIKIDEFMRTLDEVVNLATAKAARQKAKQP